MSAGRRVAGDFAEAAEKGELVGRRIELFQVVAFVGVGHFRGDVLAGLEDGLRWGMEKRINRFSIDQQQLTFIVDVIPRRPRLSVIESPLFAIFAPENLPLDRALNRKLNSSLLFDQLELRRSVPSPRLRLINFHISIPTDDNSRFLSMPTHWKTQLAYNKKMHEFSTVENGLFYFS